MTLRQRWLLYGLVACTVGLVLALIAYLVTPRSSDILPAAVATPATPSVTVATTATAAATPSPVFSFGAFGEVQNIVIEDSEMYAMIPGAQLTATLHPQGHQLVGLAVVDPANISSYTARSPQTQAIRVSEQKASAFLQGLVKAATEPPTPPITLGEPTDCGSRIDITVQATLATAHYDMSNGCKYLPWNIQYGNAHSISYAHTTDDALNIITDDVGYSMLEELAYPYKRKGR